MDACTRAFGVEEIRAEIFTQLDVRSLQSAMLVSHSWASTAVRALWGSHDVPSSALRAVHHSRRHVYGPAIRSLALYSPQTAQRDARHWDFPGIRRLVMHPQTASDVRLFDVTLGRCGAVLEGVAFAFRAELPAVAAAGDLGSVGRANNDHLSQDELGGRKRYWMHPSVLKSLARLPRLRALHTSALLTSYEVQLLCAAMPAPFVALQKCHARVLFVDWLALVDMLMQASSLTDLTVVVDSSTTGLLLPTAIDHHALRNEALKAMALRLPRQLQRLKLFFHPALRPSNERDEQLMSDDFTVLGNLSALTALAIHGGYVRIKNDVAWRRFLGGLPRLQHLRLGLTCQLPPTALVAAGECCRELRDLSLGMWSTVDAALNRIPGAGTNSAASTAAPPEPVLFPRLRRLYLERPIIFDESDDFYLDQEQHLCDMINDKFRPHAPLLGDIDLTWGFDSLRALLAEG